MIRNIKSIFRILTLIFIVSLITSGCFVLSDDITPPPNNNQKTPIPATQEPRPTSTQPETQPTTEQVTVELGEDIVVVDIIDHSGGFLLSDG